MAKNLPENENVSRAVHSALRKWGKVDDLDLNALKALRIFEGHKTSSVLTQALLELKLQSPTQAEILQRRFVQGDAIKRVSLALHISEDHANRQQREGIDALAALLLKKEEQSRRGQAENLLSHLPPRTYERLFGTEELQVFSHRKGDRGVALGILERALAKGLLASSTNERAWTESAMGRMLMKKGNPKKGKAWLKSASLLWEKLNDPWMVLDTLQVFDRTNSKQKRS